MFLGCCFFFLTHVLTKDRTAGQDKQKLSQVHVRLKVRAVYWYGLKLVYRHPDLFVHGLFQVRVEMVGDSCLWGKHGAYSYIWQKRWVGVYGYLWPKHGVASCLWPKHESIAYLPPKHEHIDLWPKQVVYRYHRLIWLHIITPSDKKWRTQAMLRWSCWPAGQWSNWPI